jgi:hypothetical protein
LTIKSEHPTLKATFVDPLLPPPPPPPPTKKTKEELFEKTTFLFFFGGGGGGKGVNPNWFLLLLNITNISQLDNSSKFSSMFANVLYETSKVRYPSTLANSKFIILFSEMLKFSPNKNYCEAK